LTRPLDRHLDGDELEALVSPNARGVNVAGQLSTEALREAQRHVESCQDCDRKVQMHGSVQRAIPQRTSGNLAKGPNCSEESDWVRIAAGLDGESETRERMKHAAQCGHCGPLLKAATKTLSDEVSPDEEAMIANLRSARPDWQAQMAQAMRSEGKSHRISQAAHSFWKTLFHWPRPAFVAVGVMLLVAAAWIGVRILRPSPEQLLAEAYTQHRTIEVRIPGAKYAPLRVERSAVGSNFDKPEPLLKAEALIGEKLLRSPNDPKWLEARGRAELLDGSYDESIKTLRRALESEPDSASLLTDIGSAYFLRAKSTNRPIDYGNAIESLGRALAKSPDDPIALFNRALACEQMFLYTQAVDDWEHYLRIDSQSEWADEARRRLTAAKEKLQQHQQSMAEPLLTPEEIASQVQNNAARAKMDTRVEEYLHVAVTQWLPQAFPPEPDKSSASSTIALNALSGLLKEHHGDTWLRDTLRQTKGTSFPKGIQQLAAAVSADDRGDYSSARYSAQHAAELFHRAANPAAEVRARAEEVYADHLLWEGKSCISLLESLAGALKTSGYSWLRAQMSLEESNCADQVGDLETYRSAIDTGVEEALAHHYQALYLRGLGFKALAQASLGYTTESFSLATRGLALFWSGQFDITKGYNLYNHLDAIADGLDLPNLQVALCREASVLLDRDPDVLKRAMAHRWYGKAAYLANDAELAESEFSKATALFTSAPQTTATSRDRLDAEVWQAKAEVRRGDLDQAASRLAQIEPALYTAPSLDPEIGYFSSMAEISMQRSDSGSTESALRSALYLAEWSLHTLSSDRDRAEWAEQTRDAYRDVVEWKLRQGDPNTALELWEWYRGAAVRKGENSEGPSAEILEPPDARDAPAIPSPTAVASLLYTLRDKTIISFAAFPDGVAVWVYDDRGIYSHWVAVSEPALRSLVIEFQRLCADPMSDLPQLRGTARSLYDLLLKPLEERLDQTRTLHFEPDEPLYGIPWEVLVDQKGQYLAANFSTTVTPGLYRFTRLRASYAVTPESPALVVSVPIAPDERLQPLMDADAEGGAVTSMFSAGRWLRGSDATISRIKKELRGKAVFHFAGHAVASVQHSGLVLAEMDPKTSTIRLVNGENISMQDASDLQLVVLSACSTGSEAQNSSPGTEGLTDALLRAGVPHVIATRWNIDSAETENFMKSFYASLLAGNLPAKALRAARVTLASRPTTTHPYFWSAFVLHGTS
jgi:CHAT domain-containing protein/tetratricopeptide (TPR) repeat protein